MKLHEVQSLIDKADYAYYTTGNSIMEDARYDALKEELKKLNPSDVRFNRVGATIRDSILEKVKHTIPMDSLNKCMNKGELDKWLDNNMLRAATFNASYKMDGCSVAIHFKDGRIVQAISRGDSFIGEDVTANVIKFQNIPSTAMLPSGETFSGSIRGEAILTNDNWKEIDPLMESNPRNLASGILRRKDGSQSEYLRLYAFRIYDENGNLMGDLEEDLFELLTKMGFDIAPNISGKIDILWKWFENVQAKRSTLPYWVDGVVLSINDIDKQNEMGSNVNAPKWAVAVKFETTSVPTKLNKVEWFCGHSGAITPVAEFDTIKIGGTNVSNASLANMDIIETLGVCIGDTIGVIKAGEIIPKVMEVIKEGSNRIPIIPPTNCPCCNSKLERKENITGEESTAIYCVNKECPAVIRGKVEKFIKSIDILGIGTEVIDALVTSGLIKDAADLYILKDKSEQVADLKLSGKTRFGEKRTEKILEEIEKKRELSVSQFLGSLGIASLGKRRVVICQEKTQGQLDSLKSWTDGSITVLANEAGIPNICHNINKDIQELRPLIDKFIKNGLVVKEGNIVKKEIPKGAKVICITGSLSRKKQYYYDLINSKGYIGSDDFTKNTTHLVAADKNSGSSKIKKAQKNGIPILDEDELMKMLQG